MVGLRQPLRLNEPASGLLSLSHYAVSLMVIGFSIERITVRLIRILRNMRRGVPSTTFFYPCQSFIPATKPAEFRYR